MLHVKQYYNLHFIALVLMFTIFGWLLFEVGFTRLWNVCKYWFEGVPFIYWGFTFRTRDAKCMWGERNGIVKIGASANQSWDWKCNIYWTKIVTLLETILERQNAILTFQQSTQLSAAIKLQARSFHSIIYSERPFISSWDRLTSNNSKKLRSN